MRVLQYGDEVWVMRNKKRGLKLKKIVTSTSFSYCKGCCLNKPNNHGCIKYGRLLSDICNKEMIIFEIANEDNKRRGRKDLEGRAGEKYDTSCDSEG